MGRKSHSKQNSKKNDGKENNKFLLQRRKELGVLIDKLLKLTSMFQPNVKKSKSWDYHLEIYSIINSIKNIEDSVTKNSYRKSSRKDNIDNFIKWLNENGASFEGTEIAEFENYDLGLKATKDFQESSLILTIPSKIMMTEENAKSSELSTFIQVDPLLKNMSNITLALFLLLEKYNPDSFWKPYIDILPEKYSTVLYFSSDELAELRPSPVFESSLKLFKSIARQYAYFYNKIHSLDIPALEKIKDIFTFDNYRWAVSTVMTRQNNIQLSKLETTAFIPLWDMCNHEQGKITTGFNKEKSHGECYALRDFKCGEQIFIFYGARSNADLFLHNGFVYPDNLFDSLSLALGISSSDALRDTKLALLGKLGLSGVTQFNLYRGNAPISAELMAFIRIFNMNQEELTKWSSQNIPSALVSYDDTSVGDEIDRRAFTYLLTRCKLIVTTYKKAQSVVPDSLHRKNIILLKQCEVEILETAISYLENALQTISTKSDK